VHGEESKKEKERRKNKEKKLKDVTSHMRPDHPCRATTTTVVMWGGVPDVVNHAKFRQSWLRGFGSMRVEICHFPMLSAMAYITG